MTSSITIAELVGHRKRKAPKRLATSEDRNEQHAVRESGQQNHRYPGLNPVD